MHDSTQQQADFPETVRQAKCAMGHGRACLARRRNMHKTGVYARRRMEQSVSSRTHINTVDDPYVYQALEMSGNGIVVPF